MIAKQLAILQAMTVHLEGIMPNADYEFDLAGRVFRGRATYGQDDPVPMVSIVENLQAENTALYAGPNGIKVADYWVLLVQGWTDIIDAEHPTDEVYRLKAAVQKRLGELIAERKDGGGPVHPESYLLGRRITGLTMGLGVVSGPRPEISDKPFFYLPVGVGIALDLTQPFV